MLLRWCRCCTREHRLGSIRSRCASRNQNKRRALIPARWYRDESLAQSRRHGNGSRRGSSWFASPFYVTSLLRLLRLLSLLEFFFFQSRTVVTVLDSIHLALFDHDSFSIRVLKETKEYWRIFENLCRIIVENHLESLKLKNCLNCLVKSLKDL